MPDSSVRESKVSKGRILVAEDDGVNQRIAEMLLQLGGYECIIAANGLQALEHLARGGIDLVLMDCEMPEMDGKTATREYRAMEPPERHVPIIALTALNHEQIQSECMAAGMDDFMQKPFDANTLYRKLSTYLDGRGSPPPMDQPLASGKPDSSLTARSDSSRTAEADAWENQPLLDLEALTALAEKTRDLDPELIRDLIGAFLEEFPSILDQLQAGFAGGDTETVAILAHRLQSRCGNLGARRLQFMFQMMEQQIRVGDTGDLHRYVENLPPVYASLKPLLKEFMKNG